MFPDWIDVAVMCTMASGGDNMVDHVNRLKGEETVVSALPPSIRTQPLCRPLWPALEENLQRKIWCECLVGRSAQWAFERKAWCAICHVCRRWWTKGFFCVSPWPVTLLTNLKMFDAASWVHLRCMEDTDCRSKRQVFQDVKEDSYQFDSDRHVTVRYSSGRNPALSFGTLQSRNVGTLPTPCQDH